MPPRAGRTRPPTRPPAGRWALFGIVLALLALRIAGFVLLVLLIVSTALLVIWFGRPVLLASPSSWTRSGGSRPAPPSPPGCSSPTMRWANTPTGALAARVIGVSGPAAGPQKDHVDSRFWSQPLVEDETHPIQLSDSANALG
jgi:hypothetical protein